MRLQQERRLTEVVCSGVHPQFFLGTEEQLAALALAGNGSRGPAWLQVTSDMLARSPQRGLHGAADVASDHVVKVNEHVIAQLDLLLCQAIAVGTAVALAWRVVRLVR